jgi:serine/threonine protein kinase
MEGLKYCHDGATTGDDGEKRKGICHRDLKPEKLLLDSNFQLKIAYFVFISVKEGIN